MMRRQHLTLMAFGLAVAAAYFAGACGSPAPKKTVPKDGGSDAGSAQCVFDSQCPTGKFCIIPPQACLRCPDDVCPSGKSCNTTTGRCEDCDGGCSSNGAGCTVRANCPANEVCIANHCGPPAPSGACTPGHGEECLAGNYCPWGTCTPGCASNADCAGSTAGPRCDTLSNSCGPCQTANDCGATNLVCQSGACVTPTSCTDRSTCGDLACIANKCSPCLNSSDCVDPSLTCQAGHCAAPAVCTATVDQQCQSQTGNSCSHCVVSGGNLTCAGCAANQTCNATTHACTGGGTDGGSTVDGGGGGGGACVWDLFASRCNCPAGLTCVDSLFGLPIDPTNLLCMAGVCR